MKNKLFVFLCGMLVCFISACSDEQEQPQPEETPQVVKDVVEALEEKVPQASDFIEVLKQTNLADVTAEKLTVFAVRNEIATKANVGLDTVSVKRHMVVGSYKKEDLTDGQELTCVSGDKLLVSKVGDEVSVNGVVITGEAIPVGDSYIYVVSKVIPEREEVPILHETTFKVWHLLTDDYLQEREPLAEVTIKVFNSSRESLGNYVTNSSGEAVVNYASDTIFYQLEKDGFQMYVDYNGDGIATGDELKEGESILFYDGSDNNMIQECFMKENRAQTELVPDYGPELLALWKSQIHYFYDQNRTLNQQLTYGYGGFSFEDIEFISDNYWTDAYQTIESGLRLQGMAENATADVELWNAFSQTIKVDLGLVYCDILGYYGQFIFLESRDSEREPTSDTNTLFAYLDELMQYLPYDSKGAVQAISARAWLNQGDYQRAYEKCQELIGSGNYSLSDEDVFATTDSKAVILGGYEDTLSFRKGIYSHPIRYVEVLLMAAESANEIGRREDAIAYLNQIVLAKGQPVIAPPGATVDEIRGYIQDLFEQELNGEGLEYSTWRRWGIIDAKLENIRNYQPRNSLLPVPKEALDKYPSLRQNAGY